MTRALLEKARAALVKSMMASGGETGCDHSLAICFCEEQAAIEAITAELAKPDAEPSWHDAPDAPGLWVVGNNLLRINELDLPVYQNSRVRWYGPIPEEGTQ